MTDLFYREYGTTEAPTVVILHGLYGSSDNWIPLAKKLAERYHVVVPDMRNHGQSFSHPLHSIEAMADDVYRLMQSFSTRKISLVGHSLGGKVAMQFALKYPEVVKKLVILDISPYGVENQDLIVAFHEKILNGFLAIKKERGIFSRKMLHEKMKSYFPEDERLHLFLSKNINIEKDGTIRLKLAIENLIENKNHLFATLDINAESLNRSVLFLIGEDSLYVSKEDCEQLKSKFVNGTVVVVKHASHWLHAERPTDVYKAIVEFL